MKLFRVCWKTRIPLIITSICYISKQKVQTKMAKFFKTRASKQKYVSPGQGVLPCFETPFSRSLSPENRWVVMAGQIPWDILVSIYQKQMGNDRTGAGGINPRVALGSLIIKHVCDLSDRETIQQIRENVYMQYFIGIPVSAIPPLSTHRCLLNCARSWHGTNQCN